MVLTPTSRSTRSWSAACSTPSPRGKVSGTGALEGLYTDQYLNDVTRTDDPWVKLWNKVWQAKGDGKPLTNFELYGMAGAYTFAQTLAAAGKDVDRQSIVSTLESKGGQIPGPTAGAVRLLQGLAPGYHRGQDHPDQGRHAGRPDQGADDR